ncbi:hypothetical protein H6P81_020106 [Aristolochia fimbriata]|uniref:TF-B3 domain-containing protein n=1 Tax=Aristolochia fimbriata TaxID=158543 RepID=A0AAV7DUQ5_ARIFI|nr:hypothetical protein H6P81_020106 [Aristolochia fimbriata]
MARNPGPCVQQKPCFFKVLLGDFSKRLRIPAAFQKHIENENLKRVILEVSSGGQWHVKLSEDNTYLQDGWATFVTENSLVRTNFLLFEYVGSLHFRVFIFDETACEKQNSITGNGCRNPVKQSIQGRVSTGFDHHSQEKSCRALKKPKFQKSCGSIPGQSRSSVGLAVEEEEVGLWKAVRCHFSPWEKEKLLEAYNSFTSNRPFFRKYIAKSHVYSFTVPLTFSRAHLPRQDAELILRDPKGQSWKVNFSPQSKNYLLAGWPAFSCSNNLREGDGCIFELVDKLVMQVHVFWLGDQPATICN